MSNFRKEIISANVFIFVSAVIVIILALGYLSHSHNQAKEACAGKHGSNKSQYDLCIHRLTQ